MPACPDWACAWLVEAGLHCLKQSWAARSCAGLAQARLKGLKLLWAQAARQGRKAKLPLRPLRNIICYISIICLVRMAFMTYKYACSKHSIYFKIIHVLSRAKGVISAVSWLTKIENNLCVISAVAGQPLWVSSLCGWLGPQPSCSQLSFNSSAPAAQP